MAEDRLRTDDGEEATTDAETDLASREQKTKKSGEGEETVGAREMELKSAPGEGRPNRDAEDKHKRTADEETTFRNKEDEAK